MARFTQHILPRRVPAALFLAALLSACTASEANMHSVQADLDGTTISLALPEGLVATPVAGGLSIRRTAEGRRIHEMTVRTATGASPVPLDRTSGSGPEAIRYGMARSEGGSGGEAVTLIAERRCGAATLRLQLDTQADEDGTADTDPALAILAGARCTPAGSRG